MCGIIGCYRAEGVTAADQAAVAAATALLRHRGPDGIGYWEQGPVAFGHARLSVIDLTSGQQPMLNEEGTVAVTLNGEIYNYQDLARDLKGRGHRFRSRADTEVIVHGYEEWGDAVVDRLDGMFAFALWDVARQRLLLARDRFGEKPLYYTSLPGQPGTFWYASEIKALLAHPEVPRALADQQLDEYLVFRHILAPATLFRGIRQVRAGHLMVVDGGSARERRYYAPAGPDAAADDPTLLRQLLAGSIERRLMSDVRLGTVLSGGIDSSLVSAIAARHRPGLDTFCVGFADPRFDERPHARAVATAIGSRHHELVVTAEDIFAELPRLTWANDEPLTHPNSIPMHLIFRFAKLERGVTVLLSGEGADEVFGGYDWYRTLERRDRYLRWPGARLAARVVPGRRGRLLRRLTDSDYPLLASGFATPAQAAELLGHPWHLPETRRMAWPERRTGLAGMFEYDQRSYLSALLQRQDRMSMAAGVEARVVFLSHPLVEWANALPPSAKVSRMHRKRPLRRLVRELLPDFHLERTKVGFALPLGSWMAPGGGLDDLVEDLQTAASPLAGWLDRSAIRACVASHRARQDQTDLLWTLVALGEWSRIFLGGRLMAAELPGARSSLLSPAPGNEVAASQAPR
jgi:asparagine synthase (glutamine-hydrolysing)